jgi:predicted nucleic acid binding AN1-type Zn finger protein
MWSLLHIIYIFVILNNKFSKIPQSTQWILQLVCEDRVLSSESMLTLQFAVSTIQNASEQFAPKYLPLFCNLRPLPIPTNETLTELGREFQSALSQ